MGDVGEKEVISTGPYQSLCSAELHLNFHMAVTQQLSTIDRPVVALTGCLNDI